MCPSCISHSNSGEVDNGALDFRNNLLPDNGVLVAGGDRFRIFQRQGIAIGFLRMKGPLKQAVFEATEVDGKFVRPPFFGRYREVPAGQHTYTIMVEFHRGFDRYRVFAKTSASLQPDRKYKASGRVEEASVSVWIIDEASGKPVSPVGSAPYKFCKVLCW
jgi:hypothetical protein